MKKSRGRALAVVLAVTLLCLFVLQFVVFATQTSRDEPALRGRAAVLHAENKSVDFPTSSTGEGTNLFVTGDDETEEMKEAIDNIRDATLPVQPVIDNFPESTTAVSSPTTADTGVEETLDDDAFAAELIREVLAENPPEEKGEREEWASHEGVGRKEFVHSTTPLPTGPYEKSCSGCSVEQGTKVEGPILLCERCRSPKRPSAVAPSILLASCNDKQWIENRNGALVCEAKKNDRSSSHRSSEEKVPTE
jgi:hypothetical protein